MPTHYLNPRRALTIDGAPASLNDLALCQNGGDPLPAGDNACNDWTAVDCDFCRHEAIMQNIAPVIRGYIRPYDYIALSEEVRHE